ncbi:MAG: glycosyltransferase family 39 protein [Proteobacteria bacterium]|nr:glycosyltransferase family 39 protein [Pseudomonadota bacterium]
MQQSSERPLGTRALLILLAVFAVLWFGTLDYRKLIKPDEGRYAEIPREMVASGDWLTPRLNDIKYFEKPALQYWATATAFTLFGEHQWTSRLWSAFCGFFGVLVSFFAARRLWGDAAGLYATCVLGSSLMWVFIGHGNTLDMGVSFFLSSAVFGFVLAQRDDATPRETRNYMWLAWLALGLAVLSKGLIGLVLPAATLVGYTLWQRDFALWRKLHLVSGLALLLAVTAPWFIAVSLANPEFARFFFIHEHFERFLTKVHGRDKAIWYFIPILLIGMLPWLATFFLMLRQVYRPEPQRRFQPRRFLLLWCVVVFGFFSVSSSKLFGYILPLFPALAALIGVHLAELVRHDARDLRWHALPVIILGAVGLAFAPDAVVLSSPEVPRELYAEYVPWLRGASALLLTGALSAFAFAWFARARAAIVSLAFGGMLFTQLALLGHDSLAPANSAYQIVERIRAQVPPGVPFFSVNTYDQTLPFYLKRTVTMVAYKDELGFGIEHEPQKFIPDLAGFEQAWRAAPQAWALLDAPTYQQLVTTGLPMQLVAQDTRRIIVRKP